MSSWEENPEVIALMRKEGKVPFITFKGIEFIPKEKALEVRKQRSMSEDFIREVRLELQKKSQDKNPLFLPRKRAFTSLDPQKCVSALEGLSTIQSFNNRPLILRQDVTSTLSEYCNQPMCDHLLAAFQQR
jgi:hypothetical protein